VDKLNAMLGSGDVPRLLYIPQGEGDRLPRFAYATKARFENLTDYLTGDKRLMQIPNPTDGPFARSFFYRKDLLDAKGLTYHKTIDELFEIGKQVTDPRKGVWAFNDITKMEAILHGLVHPDVLATSGGDARDLMESGKILFLQDGAGTWQAKKRPGRAGCPCGQGCAGTRCS
jgi:putative aldouronate transport system substrate-binding protein